MIGRLGILALLTLAASLAQAGEARLRPLGWGGFVTNDRLGDGQDRWRTGSYTLSVVLGPEGTAALPARPGALVELRFHAEGIAPANLARPAAADRLYAGILSFGAHTYFTGADLGIGGELRAGADLVLTGPATGIDRFQSDLHRVLEGAATPLPREQVADGAYPTLSAEWGRTLALGAAPVRARPFGAAQLGYETLARVGLDLEIGAPGPVLAARDPATGFRYPALMGKAGRGVTLMLGADIAAVGDSVLLPDGGPVTLRRLRHRLRAGVRLDAGPGWLFFGNAWLGPEFEEQEAGQRVGAITMNLRF
ncbi:DUF2219 family protein [Rhodobacteraceae bacterium 2CG4]|uniref:DUF2219 family protein n=1 Tax=Halovulum marinum TaxID=2662447 RepID=A0A6L5YX56_9RHOB|nr:lipid A-modifier LpxR family protein [Halovulum marinum]MSU88432.1 DUF2219 family protein [Halovulum marinum]